MVTQALQRQVDQIGQEDLARPEIKLIQNTSTAGKEAGATPGQFFNAMSGEIYTDGFEFVVLDFSIQRVYWGRDVIGDEPPMCSSLKASGYESVTGIDCHKCEFLLDNAAMVDAKARREKCTKQYIIYGLLLPNLEPFMFRAPGTSSQAVMNLISRFRFNKACWNEDKTVIDYHRFKVAVTASEQKTKAGSAWVIHFKDITPFNDAAFEKDVFLTSAQMLGQVGALPPAGSGTEKKQITTQQPAAPPPVQQTPAPVVHNVSPPAQDKPAAAATAPATAKPKKLMNLDI